ncbi:MAG: ChpI protein [Leptospiraceae bacterium]|nr:ChpI protein [Leptospiraceae bacterium]
MKTAISIPDKLFFSAEVIAKKLGIPRSQLFAKALEEFILNHSTEKITTKLNEVYEKESAKTKTKTKTESVGSRISVISLRKFLKDDSW